MELHPWTRDGDTQNHSINIKESSQNEEDKKVRLRDYLLHARQLLHDEQTLHVNTVSRYWSTFRAVLHTAYRERKIMENPNGYLERVEGIPTEKEHLSQPELITLAGTPCDHEVLKKAFLFAFQRKADRND